MRWNVLGRRGIRISAKVAFSWCSVESTQLEAHGRGRDYQNAKEAYIAACFCSMSGMHFRFAEHFDEIYVPSDKSKFIKYVYIQPDSPAGTE